MFPRTIHVVSEWYEHMLVSISLETLWDRFGCVIVTLWARVSLMGIRGLENHVTFGPRSSVKVPRNIMRELGGSALLVSCEHNLNKRIGAYGTVADL